MDADVSVKALFLGNLGKGHVQNAITKLIDVLLSTDAGNALTYGTDNGLLYMPAGLTVLQTDFFTANSLVANGGGWSKLAKAKWVLVTCVGGGASGSNGILGTTMPGGEPGGLEWLLWPAALLPAAADIYVGSGGAAPTAPVSSTYGGNSGSPSTFGTLLRAPGGRNQYPSQIVGPDNGSYKRLPQGSNKPGMPGASGSNIAPSARGEDTWLGPGPGGGSGQTIGGNGGAANAGRPALTVAGGAGSSSTTANGGNGADGPVDPFGCGAGGAGTVMGAKAGQVAGNGGFPGGGGGSVYNNNGSGNAVLATAGKGGDGRVCVVQFG